MSAENPVKARLLVSFQEARRRLSRLLRAGTANRTPRQGTKGPEQRDVAPALLFGLVGGLLRRLKR